MSTEKRRSPFAIVPVEVLADDRLTLRHIRVLMAILSFRSVDTGLAFPTREEIGQRARLPVSRVSTITTELEHLGWLKKHGNGGRSRANTYRFCVPNKVLETVPEPVTVTKSVTVTDSDLNGYRNGNETVTESVRGIEQTNTDHNIPNNNPREEVEVNPDKTKQQSSKLKTITTRYLETIGVEKDVAVEFLALRKRKRANLTPLALAGIKREAGRAGLSLNDALLVCVERGWQSFNASWLMRETKTNHQHNGAFDPVAYVNRNRTKPQPRGYAHADVIDV